MTTFLALATALAITMSAMTGASTDPLIGRWELTPEAASALPEPCRKVAYVVTENSITTESGLLRIVAEYRVDEREDLTILRQSNLRHNGQQNCQGRSAEHVVERFFMDLEVEIVDDRLRVYMFHKSEGNYLEFHRADDSP